MKRKIYTTLLFCTVSILIFTVYNFYTKRPFLSLYGKKALFEKKATEMLISSTYSKMGLVHELALSQELAERDFLRSENSRLKNLLDLKESKSPRISARILFNSLDTESGNIVVHVDSDADTTPIQKNDPVFAGEGTVLVGFILRKEKEVSQNNTRFSVSLVSAPHTVTMGYVKLENSEKESTQTNPIVQEVYRGSILGQGSGTMEMRIPTGIAILPDSAVYTEDDFLVGYVVDIKKGSQNEQVVNILSLVNITQSCDIFFERFIFFAILFLLIMKLLFASDHAGFEMKTDLISYCKSHGYEIEDIGPFSYNENDDYPEFMHACAHRMQDLLHKDVDVRAVVLGGSGQGEALVMNRYRGIRAVVYYGGYEDIVKLSREHNDANAISFGARFIDTDTAKKALAVWLETEFTQGERHERRILDIDREKKKVLFDIVRFVFLLSYFFFFAFTIFCVYKDMFGIEF
jgi:ribose 5-phosphate isomerase B